MGVLALKGFILFAFLSSLFPIKGVTNRCNKLAIGQPIGRNSHPHSSSVKVGLLKDRVEITYFLLPTIIRRFTGDRDIMGMAFMDSGRRNFNKLCQF